MENNTIATQLDLSTKDQALETNNTNEVNSLIADGELKYKDLSPEDARKVDNLVKTINPSETNSIIYFASEVHNRVSACADQLLSQVKTSSTGEIGVILVNLSKEIDFPNPKEKKSGWFSNFIKNKKNELAGLIAWHENASNNMKNIEQILKNHEMTLSTDIKKSEELFKHLQETYHEMTLYIVALDIKLQETKNLLPAFNNEIQIPSDPKEQQDLKALEDAATEMNTKLFELQQSQTLIIQQVIQNVMIKTINAKLNSRFVTARTITINAWKIAVTNAIFLLNQANAIEYLEQFKGATDKLMKHNADMVVENGRKAIQLVYSGAVCEPDTIVYVNNLMADFFTESAELAKQGEQYMMDGRKAIADSNIRVKENLVRQS